MLEAGRTFAGLRCAPMLPFNRREVLVRAGRIGIGLAGGGALAETANPMPAESQRQNLKIIVAGGHPGDAEYGCGGTVARYTELGHEVVLLHLNNGEWPVEKGGAPASVRLAEASKAAEILKARPAFAGQTNGKAILDTSHFDEFRKIVETEWPDILFTQWPIDQHRDHRATSALAFDAWLHLGKKFALLYYEVSDGEDTLQFFPTHYVNITPTEPRFQMEKILSSSFPPTTSTSPQRNPASALPATPMLLPAPPGSIPSRIKSQNSAESTAALNAPKLLCCRYKVLQ
jgi:LmbE family N-acetylglucosaminyl deacetylase